MVTAFYNIPLTFARGMITLLSNHPCNGTWVKEEFRYWNDYSVPCEEPTFNFFDNQSMLCNTSIPDSTLKRKSKSSAYHFVCKGGCARDDEWGLLLISTLIWTLPIWWWSHWMLVRSDHIWRSWYFITSLVVKWIRDWSWTTWDRFLCELFVIRWSLWGKSVICYGEDDS